MYKLLVIGLIFLLGFYFISQSTKLETFTIGDDKYKIRENCPDVLIQKGSAFFLYNSKRANVPGVNPIRFESLEEYVEFTEWQRSQGILCPVLYLQHAYNAQGDAVYKARPSPTNLQGGQPDYLVTPASLPIDTASMQDKMVPPPKDVPIQGVYGRDYIPPGGTLHGSQRQMTNLYGKYSGNTYPGFDPQNQSIGLETPLDKMFTQTIGVSPNPMDDNWGGIEYTENLVKSGYYRDNEVNKGSF